MSTKHTPGPWEIDYDTYGDELWFGGEGCGLYQIGPCSLGGGGRTPEGAAQNKADATLISAAPDMLSALKKAQMWMACEDDYGMNGHDRNVYNKTMEAINAALKKATQP